MHRARLLQNSHILNKGLLTFSACIKMDISKTNWNYLNTFQACLRTLPKALFHRETWFIRHLVLIYFFVLHLHAVYVQVRICALLSGNI